MAHLHGKGLHRHSRGDFQLCELQLFGLNTAMEAQRKNLTGLSHHPSLLLFRQHPSCEPTVRLKIELVRKFLIVVWKKAIFFVLRRKKHTLTYAYIRTPTHTRKPMHTRTDAHTHPPTQQAHAHTLLRTHAHTHTRTHALFPDISGMQKTRAIVSREFPLEFSFSD